MRWFWIDRFTEFESGQYAKAIKTVSIAEEQVQDYLPGFPIMPSSLITEGLAQTGGILVSQHTGFVEKVVLAKLSRATFHRNVHPGSTLIYEATVESLQEEGAVVSGKSFADGELQAEVDLMFAYLGSRFEGVEQFDPIDFLILLRTLGVFSVGRNKDGSAITEPEHLLVAERNLKSSSSSS